MRLPLTLTLGLLGLSFGCTDNIVCDEGELIACECDDGREGERLCGAEYKDACDCNDTPVTRDAGRDASFGFPMYDGNFFTPRVDASIDAAVDAGPPPGALASRNSSLLAIYGAEDALLVVDTQSVTRLALADGRELSRWTAPRPLTASAFDGSQLVALDGAKLTTLKASDLSQVATGNLIESCKSAVLIGKSRVVCGPNTSYDRVFYTYDATTGALVGMSDKSNFNTASMARIPGKDAFLAYGGNASGGYVYKVGDDGVPRYRSQVNYTLNVNLMNSFAFDGEPPTHLVTDNGVLLRFDVDCGGDMPNMGVTLDNCFTKDGALGVLTGNQRYSAIDNDGPVVFGLLNPNPNFYPSYGQSELVPYVVQEVDVPTRTLLSSTNVSLPSSLTLAFVALPKQKKVVVAYGMGGNPPFMAATGYTISTFPLAP